MPGLEDVQNRLDVSFSAHVAVIAQHGLCGRQSGHRNAERRAADIGQPDAMEKVDRCRIAAMLAADAQLDLRAGCATVSGAIA